MNKRIFISGRISGTKDYDVRFRSAERSLKAAGYDVINPVKIGKALPGMTYKEITEIDRYFLNYADAIYMMAGWESSPGALGEKKQAEAIGIEVIYQEEEQT